jgi:hypothetical protein
MRRSRRSAAARFDWGPDGRQLVVGDTAAWLVPVDGGAAQPLIGVVPNAVAWSPDGSRIAVRRQSNCSS